MYPQQHHQHVPFNNLQQHYFAISYPLSSDSSLHPPGTVPHENSALYLPNSTPSAAAYGAQFLKQAESIQFDHGIGSSSHDTSSVCASLLTTWNATWPHQYYTSDMAVVLPNQKTNITTTPLRCEVCKIDCNSKDVYEKHVSGKKHMRNLLAQTNPNQGSLLQIQLSSSIQGGQVLTAGGEELETKKRKVLNGGARSDSVRTCTVCNIVCNSQEVFNKHLTGKKHAAQVALMSSNGIGPYIAAFKNQGIGPWKKTPKKIKFVQPICCEVCKINCNSRDMYITHLAGKKHLKNLEKLPKPQIEAGASGATTSNAIIGPKEKPETHKPKLKEEMDIEAKKQKVVEGGAATAAIKMCTLCNVVCNSETVFSAHLAGHKHAAMVKKQGATAS